jgi:hypothetical protein
MFNSLLGKKDSARETEQQKSWTALRGLPNPTRETEQHKSWTAE